MTNSEVIPILDIAPLVDPTRAADQTALDALIRALHEALAGVGFLYIKSHGIDESVQKQIISLSKLFFLQSEEVKAAIAMKQSGLAWRGYFPVGGELTSGRPDQKEGLYFGRELGPSHHAVQKRLPLHGANLWPTGSAFTEMKSAVLTYLEQLTELGQKLMEGVALALRLPRAYFRARFTDEPTTLFRIFNYPQHVWGEGADEWGVREHTDMGFLTILWQDASGGLQVKARSGQWIAAPPIDGTFVINIGDMLEVWTHGIYRATPHRVRNQGASDRLSLPFFFDPNWHCTLEAVDRSLLPANLLAGVDPGMQSRWDGLNLRNLPPSMTYGDFVWSKVSKVFPDLAK